MKTKTSVFFEETDHVRVQPLDDDLFYVEVKPREHAYAGVGFFVHSKEAAYRLEGALRAAIRAETAPAEPLTCDTCHQPAESVNEAGMCDECHDDHAKAEAEKLRPLYEAEKAAGLTRPQEAIDEDLRIAGRGHLVRT